MVSGGSWLPGYFGVGVLGLLLVDCVVVLEGLGVGLVLCCVNFMEVDCSLDVRISFRSFSISLSRSFCLCWLSFVSDSFGWLDCCDCLAGLCFVLWRGDGRVARLVFLVVIWGDLFCKLLLSDGVV